LFQRFGVVELTCLFCFFFLLRWNVCLSSARRVDSSASSDTKHTDRSATSTISPTAIMDSPASTVLPLSPPPITSPRPTGGSSDSMPMPAVPRRTGPPRKKKNVPTPSASAVSTPTPTPAVELPATEFLPEDSVKEPAAAALKAGGAAIKEEDAAKIPVTETEVASDVPATAPKPEVTDVAAAAVGVVSGEVVDAILSAATTRAHRHEDVAPSAAAPHGDDAEVVVASGGTENVVGGPEKTSVGPRVADKEEETEDVLDKHVGGVGKAVGDVVDKPTSDVSGN
jgi:hypothetical protein